MTAAGRSEVVRLLIEHAPAEIDRHPIYGRLQGRCLISTRIAVDSLRYFGIATQPVAVAYEAMNAGAVEVLQRELAGETVTYEEALTLGARSVVTETNPSARHFGYPGHLVAVSGDELIDLDTTQVTRPQFNILAPRAARFELSSEFWNGAALGYDLQAGGRLFYQRLERPAAWNRSPDWKNRGRSAAITGAVIRRIRTALADHQDAEGEISMARVTFAAGKQR